MEKIYRSISNRKNCHSKIQILIHLNFLIGNIKLIQISRFKIYKLKFGFLKPIFNTDNIVSL